MVAVSNPFIPQGEFEQEQFRAAFYPKQASIVREALALGFGEILFRPPIRRPFPAPLPFDPRTTFLQRGVFAASDNYPDPPIPTVSSVSSGAPSGSIPPSSAASFAASSAAASSTSSSVSGLPSSVAESSVASSVVVPPESSVVPSSYIPSSTVSSSVPSSVNSSLYEPPSSPSFSLCIPYGVKVRKADGTLTNVENVSPNTSLLSLVLPGLLTDGAEGSQFSWSTITKNDWVYTVKAPGQIFHGTETSYVLINSSIKLTGEHPLLVRRGSTYAFVSAAWILKGDYLINSDLTEQEVVSARFVSGTVNTVSLTVPETNMLVTSGVWTHDGGSISEKSSGTGFSGFSTSSPGSSLTIPFSSGIASAGP